MANSGSFRIVEHVVPGEHIREYPAATANEQEETLYLAVKQYIPLDNLNPQPGDVTIIGAHANGFPKVRSSSIPKKRREADRAIWRKGTLRASLGGYIQTLESKWVSYPGYMDGRCSASRPEQCHQRGPPGK